jgi:hypothetical protein
VPGWPQLRDRSRLGVARPDHRQLPGPPSQDGSRLAFRQKWARRSRRGVGRLDALREAMTRLSPDHRIAVTLRCPRPLNWRSLPNRMPGGTVKSRLTTLSASGRPTTRRRGGKAVWQTTDSIRTCGASSATVSRRSTGGARENGWSICRPMRLRVRGRRFVFGPCLSAAVSLWPRWRWASTGCAQGPARPAALPSVSLAIVTEPSH